MEKDNNSKLLYEFLLKSEVLYLLNDFGELAIENYTRLDVSKSDFNIMFELIQERYRYIKENIDFNTPNTLASLAVFSFKSLFIGENDIIIDNIERKKEYFQLILIYSINNSLDLIKKSLITFIKELELDVKKNQFYNDKIKYLFGNVFKNSVIYFIFLLIIKNKPNPPELKEFIVKLMESVYYVKLNFNYSDLKNISYDQIVNDLYTGFINNKIVNYVNVFIKDKHLEVINFTNDQILKYINDEESTKSPGYKEKKESEKSKNIMKSANKKGAIQKKITKCEKQNKFDDKIDDKNQNVIKEETIITINNNQKEDNKITDAAKEENKNTQQKLTKLEEEFRQYKEENNKYKKKNDKIVNSLNTEITNHKIEICRLKSNLDLVKLRGSLKVFINYIYIGLNLTGDFDYESKIFRILQKLKTFTSEVYDQNLVTKTGEFISNFKEKIKSGNRLAHELNFDFSILDQIFEIVDKNKNYEDVKERLKKKSNADSVIKELVKNREKNFLNKKLLKKEEEKILKKKIRLYWL